MTYEINTAELRAYLPKLRVGDRVLLSGVIYTSRDAAHQRIFAALDSGEPLPYAMLSFITPGRRRPSLGWRWAPAGLPPPGGWIGLRPGCWIWDWRL